MGYGQTNTGRTAPVDAFRLTGGYRVIDPRHYRRYGIDPADVLVGTVAAENHPAYLLSRFGGNAFGLGLFEQAGRLEPDQHGQELDLDFGDPAAVAAQAGRLNAMNKRLGLFVRYSSLGRPFYLIPLAWLAHTTAEIQDRAEFLEDQVRAYQQDRLKEELVILLLGQPDDLVIEDLFRRLGGHRIVQVSGLEELQGLSETFDLALMPRDPIGYALDALPQPLRKHRLKPRAILDLAVYVTGKIYDRLVADGRIIVSARRTPIPGQPAIGALFRNPDDLKNFLLFSHVYRTLRRYKAPAGAGEPRLELDPADFANFLTQEVVSRRTLERLTGGQRVEELDLAQIDDMAFLDQPPKSHPFPDQAGTWPRLLEPFFSPRQHDGRGMARTRELYRARFDIDPPWADIEMVFVGDKRRPLISLKDLDTQAHTVGMRGCAVSLLAGYKDSFAYLRRVIEMVDRIRSGSFPWLALREINRLRRPFEVKPAHQGFFRDVLDLVSAGPRLKRMENCLNPLGVAGQSTPVLPNLEKLSLLGMEPRLLREAMLILLGHSTMSRIIMGKMPETSLRRLTQSVRLLPLEEAVNTARAVRLMSLAEMSALTDKPLSPDQVSQFFDLTDLVIRVATDQALDWEQIRERAITQAGGEANLALKRMLKLFALYEHLDDWADVSKAGDCEREIISDFQPEIRAGIDAAAELADTVRRFRERFADAPTPRRPYFFTRFLEFEFHGTGRLLPALGPGQGFLLLWIAVNISPTTVVNLNSLSPGPPGQKAYAERLDRVRQAIARLGVEDLDPENLDHLASRLTSQQPVFVGDSGLGITFNGRLNTVDMWLVDAEPELARLNQLVNANDGKPLHAWPSADLTEVDRLFGRLDDYLSFMESEARSPQGRRHLQGRLPRLGEAFQAVTERLRTSLTSNLFEPEHLHDHLARLTAQARHLSRLLVPELSEMAELPPAHPNYPGRTMLVFFLRAAFKFQSLVAGRIENFQDEDLLHRLALREFGPQAAGGVGVSADQMALLAETVARLKTRPELLKAVGTALVFQDLDRLPSSRRLFRDEIHFADHGPAGEALLVSLKILDRYAPSPELRRTTALFIRHHALLARVVRGEAPPSSLSPLVDQGDRDIFDAFFIHSMVAMAAVREDILTEDLMEHLLRIRRRALEVIERAGSWAEEIEAEYSSKALIPLALDELDGREPAPGPGEFFSRIQEIGNSIGPAGLTEGRRRVIALERLYRLRGLWFVDADAAALFKLKVPVEYIHQRLGLSAISRASLEKALFEAARLEKEGLAFLPAGMRELIIDRLSDLETPVILYGLAYLAEYLSPINRLKLAIIAIRAADRLPRPAGRGVVVSFKDLETIIQDRYELVNQALAGLDPAAIMGREDCIDAMLVAKSGLKVALHPEDSLVAFSFADQLMPDDFRIEAAGLDDLDQLSEVFYARLVRLRNLPFNTHAHEVALEEVYDNRVRAIASAAAKNAIDHLLAQRELEALHAAHQEIEESAASFHFNQVQRERIRNALELRRQQLRNELIIEAQEGLARVRHMGELQALWRETREKIMKNRRFIGAPVERRLARQFDRMAEQIRLFEIKSD